MLIAFATAADDVAADGDGDHSPFTAALLEHLETPGLSVQELFTHVTASVEKSTGKKQSPWTNASLSKVVRLVPGNDLPPPDKETVFWESVKDSEDPADLRAYLEQYPEGTYKVLASNRLRKLGEKRLASVDAGNLREFLGRGLSASAVDENGWTDLHYAAAANLPEVVEALLDAGADVAAGASWPEEREGPRYEAIGHFLEALGFKLDFWGIGLTPLHVAAWGNARGAALKLIAGGADIHAKDDNGTTPLQGAAGANARETLVELIKGGADIHAKDNDGNTPLHYAAYKNARETLVELIKGGADIHAKDNDGNTPLHYAAYKNAGETLVELIKGGADIHAKDNNGNTPLHDAARNNAAETLAELIKGGADIHAKDNNGNTPLHDAAWGNAAETLVELIKGGVDIHAKDNNGNTPLHDAAWGNAAETLVELIKGGADIHAKNDSGGTPLHEAAWGKAGEDAGGAHQGRRRHPCQG